MKESVRKASSEEPAILKALANELYDRLFTYLANHPDGVKLAEMEEEFGEARIRIANVLRSLMDENKVGKRDLLYFVIQKLNCKGRRV